MFGIHWPSAVLLAPLWIPLVPVAIILRTLFLAIKPLLRHVGYFDSWESEDIDRRITLACMEARSDPELALFRKMHYHRRQIREARTWLERFTGIGFGSADTVPLDPEIKQRMDEDLGDGWDIDPFVDWDASVEADDSSDSDDEWTTSEFLKSIERKSLRRGGILSASCSRPHDCVNGQLVELAPATTIFFLKDDHVYAVNREAQRRNPNLPTNDALCPRDEMEKWSRDLEEAFLKGEARAEHKNAARL